MEKFISVTKFPPQYAKQAHHWQTFYVLGYEAAAPVIALGGRRQVLGNGWAFEYMDDEGYPS